MRTCDRFAGLAFDPTMRNQAPSLPGSVGILHVNRTLFERLINLRSFQNICKSMNLTLLMLILSLILDIIH